MFRPSSVVLQGAVGQGKERLKSLFPDAPLQLATPRLDLHAPQAEFGPLFVESVNLSLSGLKHIGWAQMTRAAEWGAEFMAHSRELMVSGDCLTHHAFERQIGDGLGAYVGRIDLHIWDFEAPRCEVGYVGDVRTDGGG